jgi:hypothetical protein
MPGGGEASGFSSRAAYRRITGSLKFQYSYFQHNCTIMGISILDAREYRTNCSSARLEARVTLGRFRDNRRFQRISFFIGLPRVPRLFHIALTD